MFGRSYLDRVWTLYTCKINDFDSPAHLDLNFWGSFPKRIKNLIQCALGVLLIWHNYALITAFGSCWWPKRAENLAEIDIARKLLVVTHCKLFSPSSSVFFLFFSLGAALLVMTMHKGAQIPFKIAFEFMLKPFQNKKSQNLSKCTIFSGFFSAASCKKRHQKRCTSKNFWPILFWNGFNNLIKCFYRKKNQV